MPPPHLDIIRHVAVGGFGDKKALFPTGFVKLFAEYTRFRLQNLPNQSKKWHFFSLKAAHRNKSILICPTPVSNKPHLTKQYTTDYAALNMQSATCGQF